MKMFYGLVLLLSLAYGISMPLLAIALETMGATTRLIGLGAAMPAVGWLIGTPLIPRALRHVSLAKLAAALLVIALMAWAAMAVWRDPWFWVGLRFLFGGAIGLVYRLIEYWLTVTAPEDRRGRDIGLYGASFLAGLILGSGVQPWFGTGLAGFGAVGLLLTLVISLFFAIPMLTAPKLALGWRPVDLGIVWRAAPLALIAAMAYAIYEDNTAYLLPLFTVRAGLSEGAAALALSACALGALVGAVPMGMLSDRIGRPALLALSALIGLAGAVLLPMLAQVSSVVFLIGLFLWAGGIEGMFGASLALLADSFRGEALLRANIAYGMVYAAGALIGPLYSAQMMHLWNPYGLFLATGSVFAALFMAVLLRKAPR